MCIFLKGWGMWATFLMQFIILFVTQQCWIINFAALECQFSHRSRINTDQFPKRVPKKQASRGIWGILPQKTFFGIFNSQKSSESLRQDIYCLPYLTDFNLENFLVLFYYHWKIWPISVPAAVELDYYNIIVTNFSVQRWPALCSNPKEPTKKCKPWTRWSWDSPLSITAVCGPLSQCSNWFWIYPLQRLFAWVDHMINFR